MEKSSSLSRHPKPIPKPEAAAVATKRKLKKQSPQQVVPIESRSADTAMSALFAGHKHYCSPKDFELGPVSDIRPSATLIPVQIEHVDQLVLIARDLAGSVLILEAAATGDSTLATIERILNS